MQFSTVVPHYVFSIICLRIEQTFEYFDVLGPKVAPCTRENSSVSARAKYNKSAWISSRPCTLSLRKPNVCRTIGSPDPPAIKLNDRTETYKGSRETKTGPLCQRNVQTQTHASASITELPPLVVPVTLDFSLVFATTYYSLFRLACAFT